MAIRRVTYEQSPIATFLDFEMPRLMAASASAERERKHEVELENMRADRQLKVEAWRANEQRLTTLQDDFIAAGLKVKPEFQSKGGVELFQNILDDTKGKSKALLNTIQQGDTQISWMEDQLAELQSGRDVAARLEERYGAEIVDAQDDAWNKYMLEGQFVPGDKGQWVAEPGTELEIALKSLKSEDLSMFQGDAFRKGFESGRRTEADALDAHQQRMANLTQELDYENAKILAGNQQFDEANKRIDLALKKNKEAMVHYGNIFSGQLNIAGTPYTMIQLLDPEEQIELQLEDFENIGLHPDVKKKVSESIMGLRSAVQAGEVYAQSHFVAMATEAYDDYSTMSAAYTKIIREAEKAGISIDSQDALNKFISDNASSELVQQYLNLSEKVDSWRAVGLSDSRLLEDAKRLQSMTNKIDRLQSDILIDAIGLDRESIVNRLQSDIEIADLETDETGLHSAVGNIIRGSTAIEELQNELQKYKEAGFEGSSAAIGIGENLEDLINEKERNKILQVLQGEATAADLEDAERALNISKKTGLRYDDALKAVKEERQKGDIFSKELEHFPF